MSRSSSVDELLENGNSLRGNEYVIEGQIDEKLQWTTNRGQLVSVKIEAPAATNSSASRSRRNSAISTSTPSRNTPSA